MYHIIYIYTYIVLYIHIYNITCAHHTQQLGRRTPRVPSLCSTTSRWQSRCLRAPLNLRYGTQYACTHNARRVLQEHSHCKCDSKMVCSLVRECAYQQEFSHLLNIHALLKWTKDTIFCLEALHQLCTILNEDKSAFTIQCPVENTLLLRNNALPQRERATTHRVWLTRACVHERPCSTRTMFPPACAHERSLIPNYHRGKSTLATYAFKKQLLFLYTCMHTHMYTSGPRFQRHSAPSTRTSRRVQRRSRRGSPVCDQQFCPTRVGWFGYRIDRSGELCGLRIVLWRTLRSTWVCNCD